MGGKDCGFWCWNRHEIGTYLGAVGRWLGAGGGQGGGGTLGEAPLFQGP
ncbi:hypothetical protein PH5382_01092 [Phaeobacter sp. CECT 5382]|nr:hypothetical protein PH5382_01092 [Phaeobacter sp. CECT 5382]